MDDRKRPRAKDDDLPIVGDYSDARNARLRAEALLAEARAASGRFPAPRPPPAARPASSQPAPPSGSDAWRLDPRDVARHAQLRRQREQVGPLGRALRYSAVVLVLAGAFAVYWNFDTLRSVTIEFPALSALLPDSWSGDSGARAGGGEKSAEVESNVVVGTAAPTSVSSAADDRERPVEPTQVAPRAAPIAEPRDAPDAERAPAADTQVALSAAVESAASAQSAPAADSAAAERVPAPAVEQRPAAPPTPETFAFALPKVTVSESDASATVLIVRNGGNRGRSTVTWWTSDGTAKAGSDFVDLGRVVVTFAAGEQNRAIHIPIIGDATPEDTESFYVNLAAGDDASAEPQDRVEVVIKDDD